MKLAVSFIGTAQSGWAGLERLPRLWPAWLAVGLLCTLALVWGPYFPPPLRPHLKPAERVTHGPQVKAPIHVYYSFAGVGRAFYRRLDLNRAEEFSRDQLHATFLDGLPKNVRLKAARFIGPVLDLAYRYQVDPLWALAVMWTESHFNPKAISKVNAQGLMQVMPATAYYISRQLKWDLQPAEAYQAVKEPLINIEMGIYYLAQLLKSFNGNYRLATVAYNMGPAGVRRRLRRKLPVGVRNKYLDKVRHSYAQLANSYQKHLKRTPELWKTTLVVRKKYNKARIPKLAELLYDIRLLGEYAMDVGTNIPAPSVVL